MYGVIWYSEKQRFKQWWLWLIMIGLNAIFIFAFIKQVIWSKPVGNQPMGNLGLMGMLLVVCALTVLFFYTRLETQLSEHGVAYRFFRLDKCYKKKRLLNNPFFKSNTKILFNLHFWIIHRLPIQILSCLSRLLYCRRYP